MRTSKLAAQKVWGSAIQVCIAGVIAGGAVAATTKSVSFQDITSLTNTRTSEKHRWLATLVSVPTGSDHAMAVPTSAKKGETPRFSSKKVNHVTAVQTKEALHVLDRHHTLETGEVAKINRAIKGDRVFKPEPTQMERVAQNMLRAKPVISSVAKAKTGASFERIVAAQEFSGSATIAKETIRQSRTKIALARLLSTDEIIGGEPTYARGRKLLSSGQLQQARKAAREMAKVVEAVKAEALVVAGNPATRSSVSSYALSVDSSPTQMASAFAAVLRPAIKEAKKKKGGTSLIRLAKGDHKWAAKPLPKHAYSKSERRCLAAGVYFEARGEPNKGQQAVAQVILNRVRNPAYPKTICGVVYQNKRKRNACQFSFACDGIRDKVASRKHWRQATKVANDAVDGRFWLRSVGSSSHYHADYVWPRWRKKMRKMTKIGRHIFYRTFGGGWS